MNDKVKKYKLDSYARDIYTRQTRVGYILDKAMKSNGLFSRKFSVDEILKIGELYASLEARFWGHLELTLRRDYELNNYIVPDNYTLKYYSQENAFSMEVNHLNVVNNVYN